MAPPPFSLLKRSASLVTQSLESLQVVPLRVTSGFESARIYDDTDVKIAGTSAVFTADHVKLNEGRWYFEVTVGSVPVTRRFGKFYIGFADKDFTGTAAVSSGVGDDSHSWSGGFNLAEGSYLQLLHANQPRQMSLVCPMPSIERTNYIDDAKLNQDVRKVVFGAALDLETKTLVFSVDGKTLFDWKFTGVNCSEFIPALSATQLIDMEVNFGQKPLKYRPNGFKSVHRWLLQAQGRDEEDKEPETSVADQLQTLVSTLKDLSEKDSAALLASLKLSSEQITTIADTLKTRADALGAQLKKAAAAAATAAPADKKQ